MSDSVIKTAESIVEWEAGVAAQTKDVLHIVEL
jgi:hypothetical protein